MEKHNHFYLGRVAADGTPIFLRLPTALKGILLQGMPGTGKTAMMNLLLRQAIYSGRTSVLFFNPKTVTNEVYAVMDDAVKKTRSRRQIELPFWRVTLTEGRSSHTVNVFSDNFQCFSAIQQTQTVMSAMALSMARTYGVSWFFDAAEEVLRHIFESAKRRREPIRSFSRLHELCTAAIQPRYKGLTDEAKEAGQHAVFIIGRLARLEAIASEKTPEGVMAAGVNFERFVQEPCAAYFDLNAFANPLSAGEVTRMCLDVLFMVISTIPRKVPVLVFLDESALLLAEGMAKILNLARETNVGLVLATQSLSNLLIGQPALLEAILGTCHTQVFYSATDPSTLRTLMELAGQRRELSVSISESFGGGSSGASRTTVTHSETLVDRLNVPEIELVNSHRHLGLMRITENEGLAQFNSALFLFRWGFDRPAWEHQQFQQSAWPDVEPGTIIVGHRGPIHPERPDIDLSDNWEPEQLGTAPANTPAPRPGLEASL